MNRMHGKVATAVGSALLLLALMGGCGDVGIGDRECFTRSERMDLYCALRTAWPKYVANSVCCYGAWGLSKIDESCRKSFDCLRRYGYELKWVYRLTDWFLLEARDSRNDGMKYFKLGRAVDGSVVCRMFDLKGRSWLAVDCYAGSLRFAPIVEDAMAGFTEMWDSTTDTIVSVPDGFHAIIQGGAGMFLLRKDASGEYYRWDAVNRAEPKRWEYGFQEGYNPRSSIFIALSSETGKSYAFAVGLEPIPNSDGVLSISPCGAYMGRQYYEVWKDAYGDRRQYYAWPEKDRAEPLSNGIARFDGDMVVRDGRLVIVSPKGVVEVCCAAQSSVELNGDVRSDLPSQL